MRKICLFLAVGAMALTSCSSSDDDSNNSGTVLLKKTVETDADGNTFTSTATYNGTKLNQITADGGYVIQFTYTGDLITKIDYKLGSDIFQTETFTYTGDNLTTYVLAELDDDMGHKEVYVHNGDGSVSVTAYSGDASSQTTLDGTGTITFLGNGEVASMTNDFADNHLYTYDTKNSPFKNVTGYGKISWVDSAATGINHNITNDDSFFDTVTVYTYNPGDYPTQAIETSDGESTTTTFTYY